MAGGPTQPAPPSRAPHRLSASCGAPPRKHASCRPAGETGLDTLQPSGLADETRAPPGPPSAHGARPRRRSHSANLPQKAAHTATGGASGRNRSRSPMMGPDVGLRGARRRPHGGTGRAAGGRGSCLTDHRHGGAAASHAGRGHRGSRSPTHRPRRETDPCGRARERGPPAPTVPQSDPDRQANHAHSQVDENTVESPPKASRSRLSLNTTY